MIPQPKKRGCLYWIRLLTVGIVGGLLVASTGIEIIYVEMMVRPVNGPVSQPPVAGEAQLREVSFTGLDGARLAGWYIPSSNGAAVIMLHGYGNTRVEMLDRALAVARHGYGVLLYDERGHGESVSEPRALGWKDAADVPRAVDWLGRQPDVDPARLGILGFSIGGQIALRAAAQDARLKAVIADDPGFVSVDDAPPLNSAYEWIMYGVSWVDHLGIEWRSGVPRPEGLPSQLPRIAPRPILFIATGAPDQPGGRLIRHFYTLAGEPKSWWEIPETYHGGQFAARPQEYEQRMVAFFDATLLE